MDVFVAPTSKTVQKKAYEITNTLRRHDIKADVDLNGKKFKKLMNYADKIKVKKIIIIGENDLAKNKVTLKDMETGKQELVDIEDIVKYIEANNEI